jgi:hypothetical protein
MSKVTGKKKGLLALTLCLTLAFASAAFAEIGTNGPIKILFHGSIAPVKLPRDTMVPVGVQIGAKIKSTNGEQPPRLSKIILEINKHGVIESQGLPRCSLGKLRNSSAARAKKVCGDAEVGHGNVTSRVALPGQPAFSSNGPLLAFNGRYKGKPAIFAHVTSQGTLAITYVIIFVVEKVHGKYGTALVADVPAIASGSGYISAFDLSLKRRYHVHGQRRSYVSASCPLPPEVNIGEFKMSRSTYEFEDGTKISSTIERPCKARG